MASTLLTPELTGSTQICQTPNSATLCCFNALKVLCVFKIAVLSFDTTCTCIKSGEYHCSKTVHALLEILNSGLHYISSVLYILQS